jgi:ADP-ribose pyrophosphatase YjhB (NUDIX family)
VPKDPNGADLRARISALESAIGNPREGLPLDVFEFVSRMTPLINVDLLIKDDRGRTLLTWRDDELFGSGWHVPGGIVRYKEPAADRIRACAREELGADVSFDETPLLLTEAISPQETRGHHVSLLFRCRLLTAPTESLCASGDRPSSGEWRWHDGVPSALLEAHRHYARFL